MSEAMVQKDERSRGDVAVDEAMEPNVGCHERPDDLCQKRVK